MPGLGTEDEELCSSRLLQTLGILTICCWEASLSKTNSTLDKLFTHLNARPLVEATTYTSTTLICTFSGMKQYAPKHDPGPAHHSVPTTIESNLLKGLSRLAKGCTTLYVQTQHIGSLKIEVDKLYFH